MGSPLLARAHLFVLLRVVADITPLLHWPRTLLAGLARATHLPDRREGYSIAMAGFLIP